MNPALESLSSAFAALLEVPALTESLRRTLELAETATQAAEQASLPRGVRPDIGRLSAALALSPSLSELIRISQIVDFRDLNEAELAYLESVSLKTVRKWRTQGTGPEYRCEAGISYPLRWVWEWRERGRQKMTSQKVERGRKPAT